MKRLRPILTTAVFLVILGGFFLANRLIIPPDISRSERRELAKFPELTLTTLRTAAFMDKFEDFAADSFTLRDTLRTVRAELVFNVFFQTDKSGLYSGASGAGKFESVNEREYRLTAGKIRSVADTFLGGMDVYYAVVPDKSVFAGRYFPGFDPERAAAILAEELPGMTAIDLTSALVGEDFYKTDLHWDQTRLSGVLAALGGAISGAPWRADAWFAEASLNGTETVGEFSGVYPGQLALPMLPDVMRYLADADALQVQYMNPQTGAMEPGAVYDAALFASDDPYSFFLKGPQPLIFLTNPEADTARTLYVFRDSFTSSLEPLIALCGAYREVVLVDLRYIDSRVLSQYVTFKANADALFLYSSQILNNSTILKVN